MPALRDYHLLISHSWDYNDQYETVKKWLNNTSYFKWSDYSVPVFKPLDVTGTKELKKRLRDRINQCSCIIILSGMYVAYSYWIDYEIDTAVELGKPIIGIRPWGQERVPVKVQANARTMVGWNADSVVDAVRKYAL